MFSEKVDYQKFRKLMLRNLEELHSEVFQIREEVSQIHAWTALMFSHIDNERYLKYVEARKNIKKSKDRSSKVMDDLIQFGKENNEIIKDAREEARKLAKEKLKEYKDSID